MIKTVSFAPPRAQSSRSSAKASTAKPISAPAPVLDFESPRAASESAASGSSLSKPRVKKPSAKSQTQVSLDLFFDAPTEPIAAPVEVAKPAIKAKATKNEAETKAKAKAKAKAVKVETVTEPQIEAKSTTVEAEVKASPEVKIKTEVKAKKVRVPKDLAAQYGEKAVERPVLTPLETDAPKKRLSKAERQARRDLMKPSESLMERLARANQIVLRKPKSEPRGKGWKFACGRCGAISYFETPGGLCACGTIAVKE